MLSETMLCDLSVPDLGTFLVDNHSNHWPELVEESLALLIGERC